MPYLAISLFAGLRAAEVQRLDWAEVDLDENLIEVTAAKSKTRQRRHAPIPENLAAWIRPLAKLRGLVAPPTLRKRLAKCRRAAGFGTPGTETEDEKLAGVKLTKWPPNAMRHSYGTYRLAQCQDAARVSLEMGNSPQMVFAHYRNLVKPREAERYWKIAPAPLDKKVIAFTTSTAGRTIQLGNPNLGKAQSPKERRARQPAGAAIPWDVIERACIAGMTFMDAAKGFGVKEDTVRKRARRYRWPVPRAIGKAVQKAVQNEQVAELTARDWLAKGAVHRAIVFDKAHAAIAKANMSPPKSWREFDLADRAARRAAGLDNEEGAQQTLLIQINERIEGVDCDPIEATLLPDGPTS